MQPDDTKTCVVTEGDRKLYLRLGIFHTCEDRMILAGWADETPEMLALSAHRIQAEQQASAKVERPNRAQVAEAMQEAWNDFCDDAQAIPDDIYREGRKTFFKAGRWADMTADHLAHILERDAARAAISVAEDGW